MPANESPKHRKAILGLMIEQDDDCGGKCPSAICRLRTIVESFFDVTLRYDQTCHPFSYSMAARVQKIWKGKGKGMACIWRRSGRRIEKLRRNRWQPCQKQRKPFVNLCFIGHGIARHHDYCCRSRLSESPCRRDAGHAQPAKVDLILTGGKRRGHAQRVFILMAYQRVTASPRGQWVWWPMQDMQRAAVATTTPTNEIM